MFLRVLSLIPAAGSALFLYVAFDRVRAYEQLVAEYPHGLAASLGGMVLERYVQQDLLVAAGCLSAFALLWIAGRPRAGERPATSGGARRRARRNPFIPPIYVPADNDVGTASKTAEHSLAEGLDRELRSDARRRAQ